MARPGFIDMRLISYSICFFIISLSTAIISTVLAQKMPYKTESISTIKKEVLANVIAPCYERLASTSSLRGHMSQSDIQALLLAGTYESSMGAADSIVKAARGMSPKQRQQLYKRKLAQCSR